MTASKVPCPKCGAPQAPETKRCNVCGQRLSQPPPANGKVGSLAKTQLAGTPKSAAPAPLAGTLPLSRQNERPSTPGPGESDRPSSAPAPPPAPQQPAAGGLKKTMLGMPSFTAPGVGAAPAAGSNSAANAAGSPAKPAQARPINKTMIGVAPMPPSPGVTPPGAESARPGPAGPEPPAAGGFKRTMLGVAPPGVTQQRPGTAQASEPPGLQQEPLGATHVQFTPAAGAPATGQVTQVGPFNPSGTLHMQEGASQPPAHTATLKGDSEPPPPAPVPGSGSQQKTVLGVAMPGIAPIAPGKPRVSSSAPAPPEAPTAPNVEPAGLEDAEVAPSTRSRPLLYGLFVAAFAALVIVSLAFYFLSSPYSVEAKVVVDEQGNEQLEVACSECPDGTTSEIDGQMTSFKNGKALVRLKDPLKVGSNSLKISLLKPGDKNAETVELTVPVQFRIRGDLSGLENTPPTLRVAIQAIPGTTVVLDGTAVKLDAGGTGEYTIDISEQLKGESAEPASFEKRLPYTITPPGAESEKGEVTMRGNITLLTLDAPGPAIIIDKANFMLAGRTQKGGSVSVAGRAITVDPTGRFAQLMSVSSEGETTIIVRGSAADHAPRLVPIKIRRVESLEQEAKRLKGAFRTPFSDFASDIEKSKGSQVLVDARVVEARTDSHTTIMLVDVTNGCSAESCLARVVYGAKLSLSKDAKIAVSGTVAGSVDGPRTGSQIPELLADLVVKDAR